MKLLFSNVSETSMNSSDNSTDSSEGSPLNHMEGPNIEAEKMLPSVVSSFPIVCLTLLAFLLTS